MIAKADFRMAELTTAKVNLCIEEELSPICSTLSPVYRQLFKALTVLASLY
jgi:hypothetical protein